MSADEAALIERMAADWVAREDRAPLSRQERAQRDAWLAACSRHRGAYARAHAMLAAVMAPIGEPAPARPVQAAPRARRRAWLAACAVLVCVLGFGLRHQFDGSRQFRTDKGQVLRVPLADGSVLTLDSASRVRVHYERARRSLVLEQGEVLFDVVPDPARPFVVHASGTQVTAVGTSFSVSLNQRHSGEVEVLVREGVVDVADSHGAMAPARLPANFRAVANRNQGIRIQAMDSEELDRQLLWREGMLSFNGDTLSVAAAQFLRYSDTRILIDDPVVGSLRIVGLYSATDPIGFARSAALSLDLEVSVAEGAVRLQASRAPVGRVNGSG